MLGEKEVIAMRTAIVFAVFVAFVEFSGASAQAPGYELRNFGVYDPLGITTGDFNNDTFLDIAIADEYVGPGGTHNQQVLLNDGAGNFTFVFSPLLAPSAAHKTLVAGFFDANDTLDIVKPVGANFPGRGAVIPLQGQGDGTFRFLGSFYDTETDWPNWITAADFDRDGFLDVAVAATEIDYPSLPGRDLVSVLLGDGNLGFSSPDTFFVGLRPRGIISDDFNGDKNLDLAVVLSGEDSVAVILGLGNGTFQLSPFKCAVADSPVALVSGYLNEDLSRDIAVVNNKSENVSILLGLGNGQFSVVPSTFSVGTNPVSITEGIFGGNGAHDLAVANRGSDDVTMLIGSGDGNFTTSYTYDVAPGPRGITSGTSMETTCWISQCLVTTLIPESQTQYQCSFTSPRRGSMMSRSRWPIDSVRISQIHSIQLRLSNIQLLRIPMWIYRSTTLQDNSFAPWLMISRKQVITT